MSEDNVSGRCLSEETFGMEEGDTRTMRTTPTTQDLPDSRGGTSQKVVRSVVETRSTDGETRRQIMLVMLKSGPVTATQLGEALGLSATGIRRHVDILVEEGLAEVSQPRKVTGDKTRGRPAKSFRLTAAGRGQFGHDYDSLAAQALATLRETGGEAAVKEFARKRVAAIVEGIEIPATEDANSLEKTASALVKAFSESGYAATLTNAANGVQICQHHCPIAGVAAEFPELCEAEHEAIAMLLGHHVQPLASIAEGHDICTTNIPITPILTPTTKTPNERSGS
ncbi:Iron-sulfur cluster biosynthesis transcriptional regulator SufR [Corynebacterium pseudotuberculosis P54B96]|nr:Iron-sulfur cluster biosynthesis transcriptional regulator SufR [Corynebacterium pseudotuberculosis PAT10]AFF22248.1 Iron-sulfur cluster biosynthesis transcriptional regulator SufR [Corynebacterium pseudotuberculosis P54B96]AKC73855.1 Iron-sulfur cluster biosynthesis transcriptional regulator [Corynebacterium pseudotuberculosis]